MPQPLPPLNAVRAFEAASRHLNFSRAAEELGVTQGAISKQVLLLEDHIGARLFERLPGALALTQEGYAVRASLAPAFEHLEAAFSRFSRRKPGGQTCRMSTLASFAAQFIAPRINAFEAAHPGLKLEVLTSDRLVDLAREEVDLSVRFGAGGRDDLIEKPLVKGRLCCVAAPNLVKKLRAKNPIETVKKTRRFQVFSSDEWRKWAAAKAVCYDELGDPFIIEDFVVATDAVLAGQGVALLPEILIRKHLAAGALVCVDPEPLEWNMTYYTAHMPGADRKPHIAAVLAWLRAEVREKDAL